MSYQSLLYFLFPFPLFWLKRAYRWRHCISESGQLCEDIRACYLWCNGTDMIFFIFTGGSGGGRCSQPCYGGPRSVSGGTEAPTLPSSHHSCSLLQTDASGKSPSSPSIPWLSCLFVINAPILTLFDGAFLVSFQFFSIFNNNFPVIHRTGVRKL